MVLHEAVVRGGGRGRIQFFEHPQRSHQYASQKEALQSLFKPSAQAASLESVDSLVIANATTSPTGEIAPECEVDANTTGTRSLGRDAGRNETVLDRVSCASSSFDTASLFLPNNGKQALTSLKLLALMYTFTMSGAYGIEESVQGGGPLFAIVAVILIPLVMGVPTALVVAELATAIPSNAGFLMWINISFHRVVYFTIVLLSLLLIFVDNALYPVLFSEYVCTAVPCTPVTTKLLRAAMVVITFILNVCGVEAVGNVSIILTILTVTPFLLMFVIHLFSTGFYLNWRNITFIPPNIDWTQFIATASWNLSGLEQAGAVAEEIQNPQSSIVGALLPLVGLAWLTYIPPILTGASSSHTKIDLSQWATGYWSTVAFDVGGSALKVATISGSILSALGLTMSAMCTTSCTIAGMALTNAFPWRLSDWLCARNMRFGSYHWAITLNAIATGLFSTLLDFGPLVKVDQFLYGIRVVFIFLAFLRIREIYPALPRSFRIPLQGPFLYIASIIPIASFIGLTVVAMIQDNETLALCGGTAGACLLVSLIFCYTLRRRGFQGRIVTITVDPIHSTSPTNNNSEIISVETFNPRIGNRILTQTCHKDGKAR